MKTVYDHADIIAELGSQRQLLMAIQQTQATLNQSIQAISQQEIDMAKKLADYVTDLNTRMDALKADVAAGKTVQASAITLINGLVAQNAALKTQLQEIIDLGATPAAIAQLQLVVDGMDAQGAAMDADRAELAKAVEANTSTT